MTENFLTVEKRGDDRGMLFKALRPDDEQSAIVYIENRLQADSQMTVKDFAASLNAFIERAPVVLRPFSKDGWQDQAEKHLSNIAAETRKLQQSAISKSMDLDSRYARWLTPPKTVSAEKRAELRAHLRGLKPAEVLRLATQNGVIALAALEAPEGIAGMNDAGLVKHIERAAVLYNLKESYAGQTQKKPDINAPLAYGRDERALEDMAENAIQIYEQAQSDVKAIEAVVSQGVKFYAVTANVTPQAAFDAMGLGK